MPEFRRTTASELSPEAIGRAFRELSDEHIAAKRRDDPEGTWLAIEQRLDIRSVVGRGGLRGLPRAWSWSKGASRVTAWAAAAAVCLAVGGSAWALWGGGTPDEAGLTYKVSDPRGHDLAQAPVGTSRLLATEHEPKLVRFSDTSVVELRPYTTLRVSLLEGDAVALRLVQGSLKADVHHHDRTDYRFHAGEYEVKVVGTAFELAFEPEPARFDLNLREGRVIVADRSGQTRVVSAGQQLHLPTRGDTAEAASSKLERGESSEGVDLGRLEQHGADAGRANAPVRPVAPAPSFKDLARRGQFQAIVTAARRAGIDSVLAAKSPSELHELAQAARYTGQTALAEKVFSHLATQHARAPEGRSAAFFRGRLAEDSGRLQQAERHYHAYLAQGGGAYAAEALGREMTLVQKVSGEGAARPLASEYLKRFPRGAYRDLARTLAEGSTRRAR